MKLGSTSKKEFGKITRATFGFGGYQDANFGLTLTFEGKGWGIGEFVSAGWQEALKPGKHNKWTEDNRTKLRAEMCRKIDNILTEAKVMSIDKLVGIPVEVTFNGSSLEDWRVLTEVL